MNSSISLEQKVEAILIERFSHKMEPEMKWLLPRETPPDSSQKPFETAALFLTMDLISQSKKTSTIIQSNALLEHVRFAIDRLEEMLNKQEISETIFLSCQQELYKLVYDKGF